MTRAVIILSLALGLALGAMTGDPPARPPLRHAGYTVLAADFHVHSFPDGLPAWEVVREANRRRLDAIALTSHNSMIGWRMWTHAPWTPPAARRVIVLPGEELTGAGYHATLVGISATIPWRQPIAGSSAAAHAQGGVAILAHPTGAALRRVLDDAGLLALDGVEAAHPGMEVSSKEKAAYRQIYERALKLNPRVSAIGSSDFHYFAPIGACRTFVFAREATADGIVEAVRAGRTVACDAHGQTYGPPDLRAAVDARCREDAGSPSEGDTTASRSGTVLTWLSLFALVVLGPARTRVRV